MATVKMYAGEDFALKLSKIQTNSDEIAKKAIYEGARIVADQIKINLQGVLSDEATGELVASFGITPISEDKNGDWNAHIGFDGYDSHPSKRYPKGVPNQLKARMLESGTSRQRKRPFVRPAINATRTRAKAAMAKVIDDEIKKL